MQGSFMGTAVMYVKVFQQLLPLFGENRLGMELHAFDGKLLVAHGHDDPRGGASRHVQVRGQPLRVDDQRVVAHGGEGIFEPAKNSLPVVGDFGELAVHDRRRADDSAAEGGADGLMAEANPKDGNMGAEAFDGVAGDARFFGGAGAGGYNDLLGPQRLDLIQSDFIVAKDPDVGAELAQVVIEVVGEGVLVVDEQNHRLLHCSASSMALSMARALLSVS